MLKYGSAEYRKAALALNFEMEVVFRNNLAFFSHRDKSIYNHFANYQPGRLTLKLDENGYINLFNINSGVSVYPENPESYAEKQAEFFLKNRRPLSMDLNIDDVDDDEYAYIKCLNGLTDKFKPYASKMDFSASESEIAQLFMIGGGLFLQLQYILNNVDVKSLCVFEPDSDSFYCSMHLIDWSQIYKYFDRDGYKLRLFLLGREADNATKVGRFINEIGLYRSPLIEFYKHYSNSEVDLIDSSIRNYVRAGVSSVGFFEDERTGLAHTIDNLKKNYPFAVSGNTKPVPEVPAIVIANGPSLDLAKDFIKNSTEKAVIISAGTGLKSLLALGIKPDIHVEQERVLLVKDLIQQSGDMEVIKTIPLVALNTVHPDVLDCFDEAYVALKVADLGLELVKSLGVKNRELCFINPLVANCAAAVAVKLGFQRIYLAGVDCGMVDLNRHHAQASVVNGEDQQLTQMYKTSGDYLGAYKVLGNFGKDVYTTPIYNLSRLVLEALISDNDILVYNVGDGAKIKGAIECSYDLVLKNSPLDDKRKLVFEQLSQSFGDITVDFDQLEEVIEKLKVDSLMLIKYIHELISFGSTDREHINERLGLVHEQLTALSVYNILAFNLLNGSVSGLCYKISVYRYRLLDEDFSKWYSESKFIIDRFFEEMTDHVENKMLDFGTF